VVMRMGWVAETTQNALWFFEDKLMVRLSCIVVTRRITRSSSVSEMYCVSVVKQLTPPHGTLINVSASGTPMAFTLTLRH
jgi:hypothetical protein